MAIYSQLSLSISTFRAFYSPNNYDLPYLIPFAAEDRSFVLFKAQIHSSICEYGILLVLDLFFVLNGN